RFAQNLPAPPIAIDISEAPGRDEIIRAIALGIYQMDPVTRRVNPDAIVNGTALARIAARVLTLRGASCVRGIPTDAILSTCRISLLPARAKLRFELRCIAERRRHITPEACYLVRG